MTSVAATLTIRDLEVRFGGLVAVAGLNLDAPVARITGLIGPNGAGKSTTFNVCSGLVRPTEGAVAFDGVELTSRPSSARARCGMGRTFQRMELFETLTVAENVALGREARMAGASPLRLLLPGRGEEQTVREATERALRLCGIADIAGQRAGPLSTGQKRLVELARAVAGGFRMLLLDEPSSGLDLNESEQFSQILRTIVSSEGLGVLIVEHDMEVISGICDYVYVLDFGQLIMEGGTAEVLTSEIVRAAYLGTEPTDMKITAR